MKDKKKFKKEVKKALKDIKLNSDVKSVKSGSTNEDDVEEEDASSPDKLLDDSPDKKKEDDSPTKKKEGENKTEGADLIVAEERTYEKVSMRDYANLFSFSFGCWSIFVYFFQCLLCACIQLFITYFLTHWTSQTYEE